MQKLKLFTTALAISVFALSNFSSPKIYAVPECQTWKPTTDWLRIHEQKVTTDIYSGGNAQYIGDLDFLYNINPNTDIILFQQQNNPNYFVTVSGQRNQSGNVNPTVGIGTPSNFTIRTNPSGLSQNIAYTIEYTPSGQAIGTTSGSTTFSGSVTCINATNGYTDVSNTGIPGNDFPYAQTKYSFAKMINRLFDKDSHIKIGNAILDAVKENIAFLIGLIALVLGYRFLFNRINKVKK